jgi:transposase-like protein
MENAKFRNLLSLIDDFTDEQKGMFKQALEDENDFDKVVRILDMIVIEKGECVHCKGTHLQKFGRKNGLQRFRCVTCRKTFNSLTGTPLAHLRKKEEWLKMAAALKDSLSVKKTAAKCCVADTTAFRWRHRFLRAMQGDVAPKLTEIVEADETYFLESFKGRKAKGYEYPNGREPHKRGGTAQKAGISREQIPVLVARDRSGATVDGVLKDHSARAVKLLIGDKVCRDNILCIDGANALRSFAAKADIPYEVIPAGEFVHASNRLYHIQNVNAYHSRLKAWMQPFHGVATKYLPNYLGWRRMFEKKQQVMTPVAWVQAAARPLVKR